MTVAAAMARARDAGIDRLDAQLLLAACLQRSRAWLIAHDDAAMTDAQARTFLAWTARRASGEPIAYLLGEKEFHGLVLHVNADVLVPRPDTETLVDWALQVLHGARADAQVVDLGTGSGAIALAIKHAMPGALVTGVDKSGAALQVAQSNGERLGLPITWKQGHWWNAVHGERFDLAVSNPPYVAQGDPHLAALAHEPQAALAAGADGLDDIRIIVAQAMSHLHPGAWLLLEHGHDQAEAARSLLSAAGFAAVQSRRDLAGIERCSGGHTPH